jgi:hypothetical protein
MLTIAGMVSQEAKQFKGVLVESDFVRIGIRIATGAQLGFSSASCTPRLRRGCCDRPRMPHCCGST